MKRNILSAIRLSIIMLLLCSIIYPLTVLAIAQLTPDRGKGEKIIDNKGKVYFINIGQKFDEDYYFNSRPSAVNYNASGSGGSNKGANNPDFLKQVQQRVDIFMKKNPNTVISVDMVTASGSGLDPDISVLAANAQINRIAKFRKMDVATLQKLVNNHIEKPIFGPAKINVLKLNIDLDKLK